MKVTQDCLVELRYELRDQEGTTVESNEDEPTSYLHGRGEILAGLEEALEGQEAGASLSLSISPDKAFGDHDPAGVLSVPRSEFPPDAEIVPGDWITVSVENTEDPGEEGELDMRVIEIDPESIVLDANHPLAGQTISVEVQVVSVRAASPEEIAERATESEA